MTHLLSQEIGDRSLNECLHTGPPLTPLPFDILLRLRTYPIMLIADMKKAFLQIEVDGRTYPIMLIADMKKAFLQIEVDGRDRDCLRLL